MSPTYRKIEANIWKYALLLISNKRIFVAILGAYYLTIPDVNAQSIGIILLAGNLAGFILEIPSGYAADKLGHKQALIISHFLTFVSTALFLFATNMTWLVLASVFLSAGHAFHSGTGSAFMHETMRALKREDDYTRVMGKLSSIGFAVPIGFMVLVPFLVAESFKLPFVIGLVVDLVGLIAALSLAVPPVPQEEIDEISSKNFLEVVREGWDRGFFRFAVFAGLVSGVLFALGGFRAAYQAVVGVPIIYFGIYFGVGRVIASLLLAYSASVRKIFNSYSFLGWELGIYAILIFLLGTVRTPAVVVAVFLLSNGLHWGLSQVSSSHLLEILKGSRFKATLLSVKSQGAEIFAAAASFGVGALAARTSYPNAFMWLGVVFLLIGLPLYLYILKNRGPEHGAAQ